MSKTINARKKKQEQFWNLHWIPNKVMKRHSQFSFFSSSYFWKLWYLFNSYINDIQKRTFFWNEVRDKETDKWRQSLSQSVSHADKQKKKKKSFTSSLSQVAKQIVTDLVKQIVTSSVKQIDKTVTRSTRQTTNQTNKQIFIFRTIYLPLFLHPSAALILSAIFPSSHATILHLFPISLRSSISNNFA